MAREFAGNFYKTQRWKNARETCVQRAGGLCEICFQNGLVVPGEIVHHKIHLTPDNINDPSITLNFDNLQLLCRDCHAAVHSKKANRRYVVHGDGSVIIK